MDKSTRELLESLKEAESYEQFAKAECREFYYHSVAEFLRHMLAQKKLVLADVIKKSNMSRDYGYQIFNGTKTNPSRDKLLMIAIGMGLDLNETNTMLKLAGLAELYVRLSRDGALIYSIVNGYDIIKTNEQLDAVGEDILK